MYTCMIFLTQTTNYISPVLGGGYVFQFGIQSTRTYIYRGFFTDNINIS